MNRFLLTTDKKVDWKVPKTWWSRPYEYAFAMDNINKNDVIIDAGCGIEHPFKMMASEKCKYLYAVDKDKRLNSAIMPLNSKYIIADLMDIPNIKFDKKIDKIFCISVLEHMAEKEMLKCLENYRDTIKDDGKIILTIDYPTITPDYLTGKLKDLGLKYYGKTDYELKEKMIAMDNLNVFTAILTKG